MWLFYYTLTIIFLSGITAFAAASAKLVPLEGDRFVLDLRYATADNFLKKDVYKDFGLNRCYVHPDLETKLRKLADLLAEKKLRLVLWDCYRPLTVQKAMWKLVPDARYVADPKHGSNHNRGIAVDVSLADETGLPLSMPTSFDDFTAKASPTSVCAVEDKNKCENRALLIELMAQVGLKPLSTEWWHYQLPEARSYPIIDGLNGPTP